MVRDTKWWIKRSIAALVFIALVVSVVTIWNTGIITQDNIKGFVDGFGIWAPLVYGLIYFFALLLFIPASALSVLAGTLFGKVVGLIVVVISATAAASVAFFIARYFGKDVTDRLTRGTKIGPWIDKTDKVIGDNGFRAFFVMRSLFLPYIIVSYAAGLIKRARAIDFILATLITNAIYSGVFVFLGDSLLQGPRALILPVTLIIVVLLVPRIVKRFSKRAQQVQE